MDANASFGKIHLMTLFKCLLILCCVWGVSLYMNRPGDNNSSDSNLQTSQQGLPCLNAQFTNYPDKKFKSDKKWSSHKQDLLNIEENIHYIAEGKIGDYNISMDCVLVADGSLVGRYRNENGTTLDVNGYIESDTLKIKLGHGKDTSYLTLTPEENTSDDTYKYTGIWGKKGLPSVIIFKTNI